MYPLEFEQQSAILTKPDISDIHGRQTLSDLWTDEECGPLPIYSDGQQCISLWQMSWRERLSALFFGRVWLWIYSGRTQPPVALLVTREIFEEKEI